jgi:hypothetical protein
MEARGRSFESQISKCHTEQRRKIKPEKDLTLNTSLYVKRWSHPFVIYSDFETLLCPITSQTKTNTQLLNKHEPTGFMLYCVSTYDDVPFETTYFYRGVDCMDKFYKCLNKLSHDIREFYRKLLISTVG